MVEAPVWMYMFSLKSGNREAIMPDTFIKLIYVVARPLIELDSHNKSRLLTDQFSN